MKWKNKGHEFDIIGEKLKGKEKIYIYGAGELGESLLKKIQFVDCIAGFIDGDEEKQKKGFCGKPVEPIISFLKRKRGNHIVIVAANRENTYWFMKQLRASGYCEGEDLFEYASFADFYLPIYAAYIWNVIYVPSLCFITTTKCNLNCESCLNLTPYNKNKRHYDFEILKSDIDTFFECIDFIDLLHISGGEPLLYPELSKILEYIGVKYRNRINTLSTTTNGTILPSKELYDTLLKFDITLIVDDYREQVNKAEENWNKLVDELKQNKINYSINYVTSWIDLKPFTTDNSSLEEVELVNYSTSCQCSFISLKNKKIHSCSYADYAVEAKIVEGHENDYFDLEKFNKNNRREFLEFIMGYTERGYTEYCKRCSGYIPINKNKVPVAKQVR